MSQAKKKITELHRRTKIEKAAKENIYQIAVESIRTYLSVIEKAGKLIDAIHKEYTNNSIKSDSISINYLGDHKDFVSEEVNRSITFREYLERRKSGIFLSALIKSKLSESFRKRFIEKNADIDKDFDANRIYQESIRGNWKVLSKEIQKFHIMQEIVSEKKTPEDVMLQKYGLQKDELMTIINQIRNELRGVQVESENVTKPMEKEIKPS